MEEEKLKSLLRKGVDQSENELAPLTFWGKIGFILGCILILPVLAIFVLGPILGTEFIILSYFPINEYYGNLVMRVIGIMWLSISIFGFIFCKIGIWKDRRTAKNDNL